MALLSHCSKNSANRDGNCSARGGITLSCALFLGQDASCSCRDHSVLFAVSGDCRLDCSAWQHFRTNLLAHANSDRFTHTGLCANPEPHSYRDAEVPDAHQSQPYSKSNSNSDGDTNATVPRSECHTNSHTNATACGYVAIPPGRGSPHTAVIEARPLIVRFGRSATVYHCIFLSAI